MSTKFLTRDELKQRVEESLTEMGCTNIKFSLEKEELLDVHFDCKILTSFKTELQGWLYSGIQLDPTGERQYRIMFFKPK